MLWKYSYINSTIGSMIVFTQSSPNIQLIEYVLCVYILNQAWVCSNLEWWYRWQITLLPYIQNTQNHVNNKHQIYTQGQNSFTHESASNDPIISIFTFTYWMALVSSDKETVLIHICLGGAGDYKIQTHNTTSIHADFEQKMYA